MTKSKRGGYLNHMVKLYNGRLFNRFLSEEKEAKYNAEQGKILACLWEHHPLSAVELSKLTGLTKTTLSAMLKRLEEQGLLCSTQDPKDSRKKQYDVTEMGWAQKEIGEKVSRKVNDIFYHGFSEKEIKDFENYLERIKTNLERELEGK